MKELENANRHEAIQTIEKATKKRTIASLGEKTKCKLVFRASNVVVNSQELDYLYEAFQSEPIHVIEFDHFQSPIFPKYIPEWKDVPGLVSLVFNAFDVNNTGALVNQNMLVH